jgi:hypothetical protein
MHVHSYMLQSNLIKVNMHSLFHVYVSSSIGHFHLELRPILLHGIFLIFQIISNELIAFTVGENRLKNK